MSTQEQPRPSEWRSTLNAYADHYAAWASGLIRELDGGAEGLQLRTLARLAPEIENFQQALGTSLKFIPANVPALLHLLRQYYYLQGQFGEMYRRFEPLLDWSREYGEAAAEQQVLLALAVSALKTGQTHKAEVLAKDAIAIGQRTSNATALAEAHLHSGAIQIYLHNYPAARINFESAIQLSRAVGDISIEAWTFNALGSLEQYCGNYQASLEALEHALELQRRAGNATGEASILNNIGSLEYTRGNFQRSREMHEAGIALMQRIGNRYGFANAQVRLGNLECAEGHYPAAHERYQAAFETQLEAGHMYDAGVALLNMGNISLIQGELERSIEQSTGALDMLRLAKEQQAEATCLQNLAVAQSRLGLHSAALDTISDALEKYVSIGEDGDTVLACLAAAEVLEATEQLAVAAIVVFAVSGLQPKLELELSPQEQEQLDTVRTMVSAGLTSLKLEACEKQAEGLAVDQLADLTLQALRESILVGSTS